MVPESTDEDLGLISLRNPELKYIFLFLIYSSRWFGHNNCITQRLWLSSTPFTSDFIPNKRKMTRGEAMAVVSIVEKAVFLVTDWLSGAAGECLPFVGANG